MQTMTESTADLKTPLAERVRAFLASRGYDPATIALSRRRPSVLAPEDYATVRLLVDGPPADPTGPFAVDRLEWASATAHDPHAPTRLRALAISMLNEDYLSGRFVPPAETESERGDRDRSVAAAAVRAGDACPRPTAFGRGLTPAEFAAVTGARNDAAYRAGRCADDACDPFPTQCGLAAAAVVLRAVLARRPRFGSVTVPATIPGKIADSAPVTA